MMRTVHLIGAYGDRMIDLDADSPVMLFRGLQSQVPGFKRAMLEHPNACVVLSNDDRTEFECLTEDTAKFTLGKWTRIHIVPVTEGSYGFAEVAAYIASTYGISAVYAYAITAVIYIAAYAAISQMLAPSPETGGTKADENKSNLFDGVENITRPGGPVPIVYGKHMVGSTVLASDLSTTEIPYVPPEPDVTSPPEEEWQFGHGGS